MSKTMEDSIKRWTVKRKTALVIEIIQGKTTVSEASRSYDLTPSEIEGWVDDATRGMENSLRANPLGIPRRTVYYKPVKAAPKVDLIAPCFVGAFFANFEARRR
ncbi:DUF1153 domain-containing protein [Paracoccus zeaxanthinifaciens]|uniref:DUF1153 domain-containing protein n=1 Tax=Paracoccus zeaxanthinifaciens TaxID=187400 RepID=UPI0003B5810B|nr:DUF1153 domain-containing protein [Paracoccus zeaxanthinifaciens]